MSFHAGAQGDVGSGKTAVAFLALMAAVGGGHQGALMAPTEVLATQHAANLAAFLERLPAEQLGGRRAPTCALITGGVSSSKPLCCKPVASLRPCFANAPQLQLSSAVSSMLIRHAASLQSGQPVTSGLARSTLLFRPASGQNAVAIRTHAAQMRAKDRRELLAALEAGELDILVGTHAVISADVRFRSLALAVVDEQHKCGLCSCFC